VGGLPKILIFAYLLLAAAPVAALDAKTLVVDPRVVSIGTFKFDPRSANLNTEDDPDSRASLGKRNRVRLWQLLPIKSLL
jgi:hypothetical protein